MDEQLPSIILHWCNHLSIPSFHGDIHSGTLDLWLLPSDDPHFILFQQGVQMRLTQPILFSRKILKFPSQQQKFQPMAVQLSMKAALPLAKILATASCHSSKTGPWSLWAIVISPVERRGMHYYVLVHLQAQWWSSSGPVIHTLKSNMVFHCCLQYHTPLFHSDCFPW